MALTPPERKEIEDIVRMVFMQEWRRVSFEITEGFVECIDWYTENLAGIFEKQNEKHFTWIEQLKAKMEKLREHTHKDIPGFGR